MDDVGSAKSAPIRASSVSSASSVRSSGSLLSQRRELPLEPKNNAISTLLDSAHTQSLRTLEQVALTNINLVRPDQFGPYLADIGPEYAKYAVAHAESRAAEPLDSLDSIPAVFFDSSFNLENPRIFDVVFEKTDVLHSNVAKSAILQEKLSWYLDTVETHLIAEIAKASPSFFAALTDLRNLHTETASAVEKIAGLRADLVRVDAEQAEVGLEIVRVQRRKHNLAKLQQAVATVARAVDTSKRAAELTDPDQVFALSRESDAIISPFTTADSSLSAILDFNNNLRARVTTDLQIQFTSVLLDDLRTHVASVPTDDTIARLRSKRTQTNTYLNLPPSLKPHLRLILDALTRIDAVVPATTRHRDAVMREVRNTIKRALPTPDDVSVSSSVSTAQKSASLERALKTISSAQFEQMMASIFASISELLRRLSMHQKILLDITSSMPTIIDISNLLFNVADITQARAVRLINVRGVLDQTSFNNLYALSRLFLSECEAITGVYGSALLTAITERRERSSDANEHS